MEVWYILVNYGDCCFKVMFVDKILGVDDVCNDIYVDYGVCVKGSDGCKD